MAKVPKWFYSEARDLAVAQIPKAGLITIMEWLGRDFPSVLPDVARSASRRVAFIRHPIERLKSCYSFMYWMKEYGTAHKSGVPVDSWESFVDHTFIHDNMHWRPQSEIVEDVPNIYRRFEDIAECYEEFRPGILPWHHRTTRLPTTEYRADELMARYSADLALWSAA